jgi:Zn-dependent metalloprotease
MFKHLPNKLILVTAFCWLGFFTLRAQTSAQDIEANLSNDPRVAEYTMEPSRGTPSMIKMRTAGQTLSLGETPAFLQAVLGFGSETSFVNEGTTNTHGVQVDKFQQYTNGFKVEHGVFKALSQKAIVLGFTAEYYNLPATIQSTAGLSEAAALQQALNHVGATQYAWDYILTLGSTPEFIEAYNEVYPKGQLVFVDNYATEEVDLRLAYKFDVYAAEPLSRADIYVDANSGEILLQDATIKHTGPSHTKEEIAKTVRIATDPVQPSPALPLATGETRYAGTRTFSTSQNTNGHWVLKGITPTGVQNETRSYEGNGGLPLNITILSSLTADIADGDGTLLHPETADNNWTAAEHRKDRFSTTNPFPIANEVNNDDVALDAHWGAEVVLDYWKNVHNRLSYDDKGTKIVNYVHYGVAYDNAFWNGSSMTYGDGSYQGGTRPNGSFAPLTSMDVCAHEIAHGVCEFTSDLVYQRESGAMNEGFSDIWAAAVEDYVLTQIDGSLNYDPWGVGEQIDERDGGKQPGEAGVRALRWMDYPKAEGDPDSYGGANWIDPNCGTPTLANDYCGVHSNSGVLNKWYYLLVTGSGKPLSPGRNKQAADDEVSDKGNQYSVQGLGFMTASKISYLAETMLSPNSKFADMRAASIFAAQTLFGIGSNEEKQTTNAWYAVDIGTAYGSGGANSISFSESNIQIFSENNQISGCNDTNTYAVVLQGVDVSPAATITFSTAGSTATRGQDFELTTQSMTFNGSEIKTLFITVYDDAIVEDGETIVLSFVYNGKFQKQEFVISDNDFAPRTGTEPVVLMTESFSNGFPLGWSIVSFSDGSNTWKVDGDLTAAGRAYISDGISDIPFYDQLSPSNVILRSSLIQGAATKNVTVSFDWEAGGETEATDPDIIYDYGQFVYSLDGATYVPMDKFVGDGPLGVITKSGSYTAIINDLDGKSFFLGWKWYNDTNAGTQFSFAIDNVKVTALPAGVETRQGASATTRVHTGNSIYFMSNDNQALIAKIENASADLGCVTLSITEEGTGYSEFTHISTARPSKVFSISTENNTATYDLTVYFTDAELQAFGSNTGLIPMLVNSSNINDANDRLGNFQLNGVLTDVNVTGQFRAYTGTFNGSGSVSVVQDFVYCTLAPAPWATADIGSVSKAGTICFKDGNFELAASGNGIDDKSDSFYFTYRQLTGDGEIIARVNSLQNTNSFAKAAVMIRESLNANSKFAMTTIVANPLLTGTATRFEYRKNTGGKASSGNYQLTAIPKYIRVARVGNTVSSYMSNTNGNWTLIGSANVSMASNVYVGLAATSAVNGVSAVAEFSNVSVSGGQASARTSTPEADKATMQQGETAAVGLFPNPAVNTLNIEIAGSKIKAVAIYNTLGTEMQVVNFNSPENSATVDVSTLNKGLFIINVHTEDGRIYNRRFFKQ